MYFISGCKGTFFVLQGNVIYVTEMLHRRIEGCINGLLVVNIIFCTFVHYSKI